MQFPCEIVVVAFKHLCCEQIDHLILDETLMCNTYIVLGIAPQVWEWRVATSVLAFMIKICCYSKFTVGFESHHAKGNYGWILPFEQVKHPKAEPLRR